MAAVACFESRLCEEIRLNPHLYDSSLKEHKDQHLAADTWREIAIKLGRDEGDCRYKWKYMRDRYVKAKRKMKGRHSSRVPPIVTLLDWLSTFVKHRGAFLHDPEKCDEETDIAVQQIEMQSDDQPTVSDSNVPLRCSSSPDIYAPISTSSSGNTPPSSPTQRREKNTHKRKRKYSQTHTHHSKMEEDEDELFGRLIAKGLRELPPETKLELRTEFLATLNQVRLDLMRSQGPRNGLRLPRRQRSTHTHSQTHTQSHTQIQTQPNTHLRGDLCDAEVTEVLVKDPDVQ